MEFKDFDNERDARIFRDSKRDEKLAASLFTYGKDRYRVKVMEPSTTDRPGWTQQYLSNQAWNLERDIKDLTEIKRIIDSGELIDCDYDSVVFVAKYLEKERWLTTAKDVIDFFDGDCASEKGIDKIKTMVDTALKEYEDEWNDKGG